MNSEMVEELNDDDEEREDEAEELNDLGEPLPPKEDEFGPALRRIDHMIQTKDGRCRPAAREAYNRTVQEFRETGKYTEHIWEDFDHIIHPAGAQMAAFHAYWEATEAIEAWQDRHRGWPAGQGRDLVKVEEEAPAPVVHAVAEPGPTADAGQSTRQMQVNPYTDENDPHTDEIPVNEEAAAPSPPVGPVTLRGEVFDPKVLSHPTYGYGPTTELDIPRPSVAMRPPVGGTNEETQGWLNAVLAECHFLMREVVFRSICATDKLDERAGLLRHSMEIARTAAKVGKSIAELNRDRVIEARRKTTVEHVESVAVKGPAA